MSNLLKSIARPVIIVLCVVIVFGCIFLVETCRHKSKTIKQIDTTLSCNPTSDTLNYVKEKVKKLLIETHQITLNSREEELKCVKSLLSDADFMIIESSEDGENYHKIEQFIAKETDRSFVVDTIKTETKKGKVYFKIYGKSTTVKQIKSGPDAKKAQELRIPMAFQGKLKGNTRRIKIISQISENNIVEFSYSVIGSYNEKNKKGNINFTSNEAFFETMGKGKIVQKNSEMTIIFESSNTEIKSINQ
jgi:hypothetical protein